MKRMCAKLLWLLVLLAGMGNALAFYNPTTGRWLSRDPIEEEGGKSLYAIVNNAPIASFDRLGLSNFSSIDIGPRSYGKCGGFPADGCTTLDSWVLFSDVEPCRGQCGFKVRVSRCWARASSWWDPSRSDSQAHEATHRFIWEQAWDEAVSAARRLAGGCYSMRPAHCYRAAISLYRDAFQWDGAANNWEWDCALFGQLYPGLCTNAQSHRSEATRLLSAAAQKEAECHSMP
jgi:hypothetical protein